MSEVLDLTLSPPVLKRLQSNTQITITPISELRTNKLGKDRHHSKSTHFVECTNLSHTKTSAGGNSKTSAPAKTYQATSRKLKQTKMTDFLSPCETLLKCPEVITPPLLDLPDSIFMGSQLLADYQASCNLLNSTADTDFGKPIKMTDPHLDLYLRTCNLALCKELSTPGPEVISHGSLSTPFTGNLTLSARRLDSCCSSSLLSPNGSKPEDLDNYGLKTILPEIRDILKELKQLVTSIEGHLKKNKASPTSYKGDHLDNEQGAFLQQEGDKMNYYSLSPGTIEKINKLSLEELLLCVGPQPEVLANSAPSRSSPSDLSAPRCTAGNPCKEVQEQEPSTSLQLSRKKHTLCPAKKGKQLKQPQQEPKPQVRKVHRKLTSKKGRKRRGLNFKPLYKILEASETTTKGISNKNTQPKGGQPSTCLNSAPSRLPLDTSPKYMRKSDLQSSICDSLGQGPRSDRGNRQRQPPEASQTIPSSRNSDSPSEYSIPVIIGNRFYNKRHPIRGGRWHNQVKRQGLLYDHLNKVPESRSLHFRHSYANLYRGKFA